jgi:HSP20 family protein
MEGTMSTLMRWDPFRELEDVQNRLSRLLGERPGDEEAFFHGWVPAVDVQESDKEYGIKVDLPDVKKEDVKVEVADGAITIQGERRQEKDEKGKRFHRIERQYGQFIRRFALPGEVDATKVQAEFKDGVLKVTLPKSAAAKARSVEVKVA